MLMDLEDITSRLKSPDNLLNRINSPKTAEIVSEPSSVENDNAPSVDDLVDDFATKVQLGLAVTSATDVMLDSLNQLKARIYEADSPKELAKIASDMSKIVTGIRNAEKPSRDTNISNQQVIIFRPVINNESHYETVHVAE